MTENKKEQEPSPTVRASISFPRETYATLEQLAKKNKVSLAWIVREAVESYLGEKWPLFKDKEL